MAVVAHKVSASRMKRMREDPLSYQMEGNPNELIPMSRVKKSEEKQSRMPMDTIQIGGVLRLGALVGIAVGGPQIGGIISAIKILGSALRIFGGLAARAFKKMSDWWNGEGIDLKDISQLWNAKYGEISNYSPNIQVLLDELHRNKVQRVEELQADSEKASLLTEMPALQLAVMAYTSNREIASGKKLYREMNMENSTDRENYKALTMHLLKALHQLPQEWKTTYRGSNAAGLADIYEVDKIIVWASFASTTTNEKLAELYAGNSENSTIFEIEAYHGRYISNGSAFPEEEEVLLPPLTTFKVLSVTNRKSSIYGDEVRCIKLQEQHIAKGVKCVLWVDDNPPNNKEIMEQAERAGVCCIMITTTEDAIAFLKDGANIFLMNEPISKFRIITDMTRGDDNAAGAKFVKALREDLGYKKTVLVYTGYRPGSIARLQEHGMNSNVIVTTDFYGAVKYALFG